MTVHGVSKNYTTQSVDPQQTTPSGPTKPSESASFGSMQNLKDTEPKLYDAMVYSLVEKINSESQKSEDRRKELDKKNQ